MFKHKLIKSDGVTEITGIKSFRFHEQLDTQGVLKVGNVVSGFIEFEFYIDVNGGTLSVGDVLTYYQDKDFNKKFEQANQTYSLQIGLFTVKESKVNKNICSVVAYDNIIKLNIDYSVRLRTLQNSFPMKIINLLDDAATYAGVTSHIGHSGLATILSEGDLSAFYTDNITVRDIFSYAGALLGINIVANTDGSIGANQYAVKSGNTSWYQSDYYVICPTDQQTYYHPITSGLELVPVFYKQDGLMEDDFNLNPYDCVKVYKTDGTLFSSYTPSGSSESNPYIYFGNLFLDFVTVGSVYADRVASYIYNQISSAQLHTPIKISLFPFRCPYRVGAITCFYDLNGSVVRIPIMSIDWQDDQVTVELFGQDTDSTRYSQDYTADERTTVLSALINNKVSKSGDTMNGDLTIAEETVATLILQNLSVDMGTAPQENTSVGAVYLKGIGQTNFGWLYNLYTTGRSSQTKIGARNNGSGSNVDNAVSLNVSNSGVRTVGLSEAKPWRAALELGTDGIFPLTVAQGGTGGTTIATALNSLGIKGFQIAAGQSQTIEFNGNGCFVFGARGDTSFVAAVDFWSSSVSVLPIGSGGAGVTITKSANVHSITITNTRSSLAIIGAVIPAITA